MNETIQRAAVTLEPKVIAWRRDIHQHPELGNREFRTSELVASHLESLGLEVKRGIAHTGVVGLLRGVDGGPVVALRADMDALPVVERVDVPFASRVRTEYNGSEVGVMHACGHDAHVAILMGVAELLASMRDDLHGTVKFIFQPAEEGPPEGEEGGAELMVRQGVLKDPVPEVIFGLHVTSRHEVGTIFYRPEGAMASTDDLRLTIRGRQTHGAYPWLGVDPIVVASQIVLGLQTIVSRQLDLTLAPAVVTIGSIHGGVRHNIIPEEVVLHGTMRTMDEAMRLEVRRKVENTIRGIAASQGAEVTVEIHHGYPVTWNDPSLVEKMLPTLRRVAGEGHVFLGPPVLGAEDFSYYQKEIPGLFFFLGTRPKNVREENAASNHSPEFYVDESGLELGVRALAQLVVDYQNLEPGAR